MPASWRYSVKSSAMRLVSVVTRRAIAFLRRRRPGLEHEIVDLRLDRPDLDRRVDQPGRADDLLGEDAAGLLHLPWPRRGRDAHRLRAHRVPFVEAQRAVVDAGRQAKAILRQRDLAAMVAPRHAADLRDGLVALVDEQQRVLGEIFEQRRRRLAGQTAGEEARVVLDAGAGAGRRDHLEIEVGALLDPLRLDQLAPRRTSSFSRSASSCLMASVACLSVGPGVT